MLSRGLFGFIARLRRPPVSDSDADLLDRFVQKADESAFTGIVRRHGPMVLSVCERRLGRTPDAEDAFQAVFLALASSARSIGQRNSLPGWLYRVAFLVSLKAAGRRARHCLVGLPSAEAPMPDQPLPAWETDELKAVIDGEVAELPIRLRAVVVLCLIEGRTNAEAAALLGIPVGTVDSRLNAARTKLRVRLTRRGVTVGVGVTLQQMLGGPVEAAGPRFLDLVSQTIPAILMEAAKPGAGAVSPAVADLARRVTMTTKLRFATALGLAFGLIGGASAGIYLAAGADDPPVAKALEPQLAPGDGKKADGPKAADLEKAGGGSAALLKPFGKTVPAEGMRLQDLLETIEDQTGLVVRVDVAAFRRLNASERDEGAKTGVEGFLKAIYDSKAILPRRAEKLPMRDVLADALAQIRIYYPCTYQVRGSQLVIVPSFMPPLLPGVDPLNPSTDPNDPPAEQLIPAPQLHEQIYGGVVSISAERQPLADILADLRKQTGANIVFDPRCDIPEKKVALTIALNDVRLFDALRVIADMAELKMVYAGNIYYVTTPANAKLFQPAPPPPKPPMVSPVPAPTPMPIPAPEKKP